MDTTAQETPAKPTPADQRDNHSGTDSETENAQMDLASQVEHWKAMSRKNEERAKANAEKAKRFDELEEQSKSELQKAQEAYAAEKARASSLELQVLASQVAARHGIDPVLLHGKDAEELEANAQALLAWRDKQVGSQPALASSSKDAGNQGEDIGGPEQLTREDLQSMTPAEIVKAQKAGKLKHLMGR